MLTYVIERIAENAPKLQELIKTIQHVHAGSRSFVPSFIEIPSVTKVKSRHAK